MACRKYKVKYKTELPKGIKEQLSKHTKRVKPKREVSIPLTGKVLRKYGKRMTVGDLRKL